jgi:histone H3/H4
VRRLAHDAQQRLTKSTYDAAIDELDVFLARVLALSLQAASFSRRKVICREHIVFATASMGMALPQELRDATIEDLGQLQRCNIRAPAEQRKQSALYAELPEASFTRFLRTAAGRVNINLRIKAPARRFLQLIAEQHVLLHFAKASKLCEVSRTDASTASALSSVMSCSQQEAQALVDLLLRLLNKIPPLLHMSKTQTVSTRLLRAAADGIECTDATKLRAEQVLLRPIEKKMLHVCCRILRGRVPDKRVSSAAAAELASVLYSWHTTLSACLIIPDKH